MLILEGKLICNTIQNTQLSLLKCTDALPQNCKAPEDVVFIRECSETPIGEPTMILKTEVHDSCIKATVELCAKFFVTQGLYTHGHTILTWGPDWYLLRWDCRTESAKSIQKNVRHRWQKTSHAPWFPNLRIDWMIQKPGIEKWSALLGLSPKGKGNVSVELLTASLNWRGLNARQWN